MAPRRNPTQTSTRGRPSATAQATAAMPPPPETEAAPPVPAGPAPVILPPPPPLFALTPAHVNRGILDFTAESGRSTFKAMAKQVQPKGEPLFSCNDNELFQFWRMLSAAPKNTNGPTHKESFVSPRSRIARPQHCGSLQGHHPRRNCRT